MTHDELLARIAKLSITPETNVVPSELATALMAVVELHKPTEWYGNDSLVCGYCFSLNYERTGLEMEPESFKYPCQTIQAIEKELQ
jgi:hypothetical protein